MDDRAVSHDALLNVNSFTLRDLDKDVRKHIKNCIRYYVDDLSKMYVPKEGISVKKELDIDQFMKLIKSQGWNLGDLFEALYNRLGYIGTYDAILKHVAAKGNQKLIDLFASAVAPYYDRPDMYDDKGNPKCPVPLPSLIENGKVIKTKKLLPTRIDDFDTRLMARIWQDLDLGYHGFTTWKRMATILTIPEALFKSNKNAADFINSFKNSSYLNVFKMVKALEDMGMIGTVRAIAEMYNLRDYRIEAPTINFKVSFSGKPYFPRSLYDMDEEERQNMFKYLEQSVSSYRYWRDFAIEDEPDAPAYTLDVYKSSKDFFERWLKKYPKESGYKFIENVEKINYASLISILKEKYDFSKYYEWQKLPIAEVDKHYFIDFRNRGLTSPLPKDYKDFPEDFKWVITRLCDYSEFWHKIFTDEHPRAPYTECYKYKNSKEYFDVFRAKYQDFSGYRLVKAIEKRSRPDLMREIGGFFDLSDWEEWNRDPIKFESGKRSFRDENIQGSWELINKTSLLELEGSPSKARKAEAERKISGCIECKLPESKADYRSSACGHTFCEDCIMALGLLRKCDTEPLCNFCGTPSGGYVKNT